MNASISFDAANEWWDSLVIDDDWGLPSVFGGALVSELIRSDEEAHAHGWLPSSLQASFHAPTLPGTISVQHRRLSIEKSMMTSLVQSSNGTKPTASIVIDWTRAERLPRLQSGGSPELPPERPPSNGGLESRVDWRAEAAWPSASGSVVAWIHPRDEEHFLPDGYFHPGWFAIAGDLLAPAVLEPGESMRIATLTLQVSVVALPERGWLKQSLVAERHDKRCTGRVDLTTANGDAVAHVTQSALLLPATPSEMPYCATGFGWGRPRPQ